MISSALVSFLPASFPDISLPMILLGVLCTLAVSYFVYSRFFASKQKETFVQEISQEAPQESEQETPDSQASQPLMPEQDDSTQESPMA